jgi:hypothetical protein
LIRDVQPLFAFRQEKEMTYFATPVYIFVVFFLKNTYVCNCPYDGKAIPPDLNDSA